MTQFHAKVMYRESYVMKLRTFLEHSTDGISTVRFSHIFAAVIVQRQLRRCKPNLSAFSMDLRVVNLTLPWRWYLHTIVTVVIFCTSMKPGILTPLRIYCRGGKGWLMLRITPEQSSSVENERNALLRTEAAAIEELRA